MFGFIKFDSTLLDMESYCIDEERKLFRVEIEKEYFCGNSIINAICSFADEKFSMLEICLS